MPSPTPTDPPPAPTLRAPRITAWVMSHLAGKPNQGRRPLLLIIALVAVIGYLDYATGPRFSIVVLYLVPIGLSVARLGWRSACQIAVIGVAVRVTGDLAWGPYQYPSVAYWNRFADLMMYFVIIWMLHALVTLQRELERRVEERTHALQESIAARQQLERDLLEIGSRERHAIGRELHDDLCQQLVGTAFAAKVLGEQLAASDPAAANKAQSIVNYVEGSIAKTRELARGLILGSIEPSDLPDELAELAVEGSASGVPCHFKLEGNPDIQSAGTAAQLFRIAQEAMRNALRHASPKRVNIILSGNGDATFLTIEDNGTGLPQPADRGGGMGLQIMAHRAAYIGGTLSVVPAPGEGTRVICHLPRASVTETP